MTDYKNEVRLVTRNVIVGRAETESEAVKEALALIKRRGEEGRFREGEVIARDIAREETIKTFSEFKEYFESAFFLESGDSLTVKTVSVFIGKIPLNTLVNTEEGDNFKRFRNSADFPFFTDYVYFLANGEEPEFFAFDLENRAEFPGLVYVKEKYNEDYDRKGFVISFEEVKTVEEGEAIIRGLIAVKDKDFSELVRFSEENNGKISFD
jgi:hypothetical protein